MKKFLSIILSISIFFAVTPIGTFTVSAESEYTREDPEINSLQIEDVSICEYSYGQYRDGYFEYNVLPSKFKVKLKDGTEISNPDSFSSVQIGDVWYYLSVKQADQSTNHWSVGNTYQLTASILGVESTFNVTITESLVESVEIEDTSIIVGANCENGIYNLCIPPYKVKLKDGREFSCDNSDGNIYDVGDLYTNELQLQETKKWELGKTYSVTGNFTGKFGGISGEFNVSIVDNPVESVEVSDVSFYEFTNGHYTEDKNGKEYYEYNSHRVFACDTPMVAKCILSDGEILYTGPYRFAGAGGGSNGIYIDNQYYEFDVAKDNQAEEHWGVGTYKAKTSLLGIETEFNVNIIENPIESLDIADYTVFADTNSRAFKFTVDPLVEVTYKDGTVLHKPLSSLCIKSYYDGIYGSEVPSSHFVGGYWYTEAQVPPAPTVGVYNFSVTVAGKTYPFKVKIIDNPIKSIELIKNPLKMSYNSRETASINGAVFRLHYNDDTFEDIQFNNDTNGFFENYFYSRKYNQILTVSSTIKSSNLIISITGKELILPITLSEDYKKIKNISLKSDDGKTLILTVTNNDNSSYDARIFNIYAYAGWGDEETGEEYLSESPTVKTNKGDFQCKNIGFTENYIYFEIVIDGVEYKTNVLYNYNFINTPFYPFNNLAYSTNFSSLPKHYNGKINAENIDYIISYARCDYNGEQGVICTLSGDEVKAAVSEKFAIEDIDLTLSKYYDSINDNYTLDGRYSFGYNNNIYLIKSEYNSGVYNLEYADCNEKIYVKTDENLRIISVNYDYISGDINGDDAVNNKDLTRLFQYLSDWDVEVNEAALDVNGDGSVNNKDLTRLFQYLSGWEVEIF